MSGEGTTMVVAIAAVGAHAMWCANVNIVSYAKQAPEISRCKMDVQRFAPARAAFVCTRMDGGV